jgi:hypothetical protein
MNIADEDADPKSVSKLHLSYEVMPHALRV